MTDGVAEDEVAFPFGQRGCAGGEGGGGRGEVGYQNVVGRNHLGVGR